MKLKSSTGTEHQSGFTLIELMVVIVIIGIIVKIAMPMYTNSVLASHRTDAKTALLDLATREEQFYSTQNQYSQTASDLYGAGVTAFPDPQSGATPYYTLGVTTTASNAGYTATATLIVPGDACGNFTITNTGLTGNSSNTATTCW